MSLLVVHRMLLNSDDEKYSHFLINYSTTFLRYLTLTEYILPLFYLVLFHPSLHFLYFNCLLLFLDKSLHYTLPSFPPHSSFLSSLLSLHYLITLPSFLFSSLSLPFLLTLPSFPPHSPFLSFSYSSERDWWSWKCTYAMWHKWVHGTWDAYTEWIW